MRIRGHCGVDESVLAGVGIHKLQILTDYLPAFTQASTSAPQTVYIDLMSGSVANQEKYTGQELDGSPRVALKAQPGFTHLLFCELDEKADALGKSLREDFPNRNFKVLKGDCNRTFEQVPKLLERDGLLHAPMFIFIDQYAAEIEWKTIEAAALMKHGGREAKYKPELWILVSPSMTIRGAAENATNSDKFREKVDRFYGNKDWRRILTAREGELIDAAEYRNEMVNLVRFQLAEKLGYKYTHHINMVMEKNTPIYDMVFASDNEAGDRIMRHCYTKAAEREPGMKREAQILREERKSEALGQGGLFALDTLKDVEPKKLGTWEPKPHWDPARNSWWSNLAATSPGY